MHVLKFGIVSEAYDREWFSRQQLHQRVPQHQGLLVLSDGVHSKTMDDLDVKLLANHPDALALMTAHFFEEKGMKADFAEKMRVLTNEEYCQDDLTWFTNQDHYPITWFDTLEEALNQVKERPAKLTIFESRAITQQ